MTITVPTPAQQPHQFILDRPKYDRVEAQTRFEKARAFARGQGVLFHGTRYRESVLASGILRFTPSAQTLSFTRSPDVAAHWAALPRDDDEGAGAVLVFDRASLRARYNLECIDGWHSGTGGRPDAAPQRSLYILSGIPYDSSAPHSTPSGVTDWTFSG